MSGSQTIVILPQSESVKSQFRKVTELFLCCDIQEITRFLVIMNQFLSFFISLLKMYFIQVKEFSA